MTTATHHVAVPGKSLSRSPSPNSAPASRSCCCTAGRARQSVQPGSESSSPPSTVCAFSSRPTQASAERRGPDGLTGIPRLAALYLRLLEDLGLEDVTVIGNSIGGWITAEIALLQSPRVSGIVLIDAVGIEVPGHPVADFFAMTMDEVFTRTFHDPAPFRFDPATLPPEAQAVAAGNRAALAAYAGASMSDPTLAGRLADLEIPTLVLWGDSDRIADPDYGRAYASAIPMAKFQLLTDTGHAPQQETPDQVLRAIWDSGIPSGPAAE